MEICDLRMKEKIKSLLLLHAMLLCYSLGGICSKLASKQQFLSAKFVLYYSAVIVILIVYAVAWQQILKRLPLLTAYANKAVTVIWGMIWGGLLFGESIQIRNVIGAAIIIFGVFMVVSDVEKS